MSSSVALSKELLRASHLSHRIERAVDERSRAAEAVAAHAAGMAALSRATRVASYLSMPSEPGTGPLHDLLAQRGIEVIVPRSLPDRTMEWVQLADTAPHRGELGVPEPTGPACPADALASCDVVFVPALAVDHQGHRLGRGAGYYDRALTDARAVLCAVVFSDELLPQVPHEAHDITMDLALTPDGVFRPERDR